VHVATASNSYSPAARTGIRLFQRFFQSGHGFQLFIFLVSFVGTYAYFTPFLRLYQSNNSHRTLDNAIEVEKAWKKKQAELEAAEAEAEE